MKKINGNIYFSFLVLFSLSGLSQSAHIEDNNTNSTIAQNVKPFESSLISAICNEQIKKLPSTLNEKDTLNLCQKMKLEHSCQSFENKPIYYYEKLSQKNNSKKILVLGLIHGDEGPSGTLAAWWIKRLEELDNPSNSWRILPVTNPDGFKKLTRVNARGVDLNRNFPTQDWSQAALKAWQEKTSSNPRRYPGPTAGSEPETKCITDHINDFNPDFIIAIHTPYAVLDFDGPNLKFPKFLQLPWQTLGNFPGSLGRFMWVDQKVPVLTIEMKGSLPFNPGYLLKLQDISAQVAQMSSGAKIKIVQNK